MKRLGASLFASALVFLAASAASAAPADRLHVVVVHTNDVHGQVLTRRATWLSKDDPPEIGGLPRIAAFVKRVRAEAVESGEGFLAVDAGDWYQGTPEGLVDDGLGMVKALALVGYDAMCIGNHEFDRGIDNVLRLLRESGVPSVCANIELKATSKPVEWTKPWRIVEVHGKSADGPWTLRVGIVGLLTPTTPEITGGDVTSLAFTNPEKAFARAKAELAGKVDWILPVTHLGVEEDRKLARSDPDLALIVGGHSHTYLKEPAKEGGASIVQTGSKGSAIGRVDVWLDPASKKVVDLHARLVDLLEAPEPAARDERVEKACAELEGKSSERMKEVVGELTAPAMRGREALVSSTAGNLITDALRAHTKADVALMNRGGIRSDMEAGAVTRRAVFEIMPFDNAVSIVTLKGAELEELLKRAVEGTAHSGIEISGATIEARVGADKKRTLVAVRVGDKALDPAATYKVAMNSFMADGGDAYMTKKDPPVRVDEPTLIRDVLEEYFVAQKKVTPSSENRFVARTP